MIEQATCSTCNKPLFGRSDKVFCSSNCKNRHHYTAKKIFLAGKNSKDKNTNRSYIVLQGIMHYAAKSMRIHYKLLFKHDFDLFSYEEEVQFNGQTFYKIKEFLFRRWQNGTVEIHRMEKQDRKSDIFFNRWKVAFGRIRNFLEETKVIYEGLVIERAFYSHSDSTVTPFVSRE